MNPPATPPGLDLTRVTGTREGRRIKQTAAGTAAWDHWGPYLSERAWGTVREDYSADGTAWDYFPHDHARSRVYRWNEDGLAGICDGTSTSASRSRCGTARTRS